MKKWVTGGLITVLVLALLTVSAFAAPAGRNYVDADGDGVCDYWAEGIGCQKGNCRHAGGCARRCAGVGCRFVDADGDGVCDLLAAGALQTTGTEGGTVGAGIGTGVCGYDGCAFVDSNGDGVCDLHGACGTGRGHGCGSWSAGGHHQGGHHQGGHHQGGHHRGW